MKLQTKSIKGMLVEVIVKSTIEGNVLEYYKVLKDILQENLNSNLKFYTNVSIIMIDDITLNGQVQFDNNGEPTVIYFTVISGEVKI
jgi:hypothetical protein